MCNCGKNNRQIGSRRNAHFDRGSRNPDIRQPKIDVDVESLALHLGNIPEPQPTVMPVMIENPTGQT